MYLPEQKVHLIHTILWATALLPLYCVSGSTIASMALLSIVLITMATWPWLTTSVVKSKNDFISYWVSEYKFYEFAMKAKAMASDSLKTEKNNVKCLISEKPKWISLNYNNS